MGFGWLLLGYIVSFVLNTVAKQLNAGFAAQMIGYLLMLRGLWELRKYRREFRFPLWGVLLLFPETVYNALRELGETFLWRIPFVNDTVTQAVGWAEFAVLVLMHLTLYCAVARLGQEVELPRTVKDAVFDGIVCLLYVVLYIVSRLPAVAPYAGQFAVPLTVYLLFWRVCDIFLLVSCCKNICPEGDEEVAPRKYRWEFLNRLGDSFSANFRRAADSTRNAREESLRRKRERKKRK